MRTHELVLDWVEQELSAGRLRLGERLPGERALAEQLSVSRTAVREAVKVLEAMGVVHSGVGSGPQAGTIVIAEPSGALGSALRLHLATNHLVAGDLVQARVLLENWAARTAPADAPPLAVMEELLEAMDAPGLSVEEFLALDAEFHVQLAAAAGNPLIGVMMAALREGIRGYTRDHAQQLRDWAGMSERLRREHRGIVAAVREGDSAGAGERVTAHIQGYFAAR